MPKKKKHILSTVGEPYRFKKGQSGNPAGRPPKFLSTLKDQGYKQAEVNDTMRVVLSMQDIELSKIDKDPRATILERILAKALIKARKNGNLRDLESVITRPFGAPKQVIEQAAAEETTEEIDYSKLSDATLKEIAAAKITKTKKK